MEDRIILAGITAAKIRCGMKWNQQPLRKQSWQEAMKRLDSAWAEIIHNWWVESPEMKGN